jgi:hypothetical protein
MGFLRKTLYTIVGLPAAALGAEYFYTGKCHEVPPTDRLPTHSPLVTKRMAENKARLDRFERVVPLSSLVASSKSTDEVTLSRQLAKQMWLTRAYAPQRKLCERIFKAHQEEGCNLTAEEIKAAKIQPGFDVSQHLYVSDVVGSYVQFVPRVPPEVDFQGPGGVVSVDVHKRGENMVFAIESATVGIKTTGDLSPMDAVQFFLHKVYARLLLEEGVRRVLHGEGE